MKLLMLIGVFCAVGLVRSDDQTPNCHCKLSIRGDNTPASPTIFVDYHTSLMSQVHDCDDVEGCSQKCVDMMNEKSNGGDLNSTPPEINDGLSIGDLGCHFLGQDVDEGIVSLYSKVCDHDKVKTNFTFKTHLCCRNKKHSDNCQH